MSEVIKSLTSIRTLRAQSKECTLETLEAIRKKLKVIINEKREEEVAVLAKIEQRKRKLQQYRKMLIADGIHPSDLLNEVNTVIKSSKKNKRAPRPAKYSFIDSDGETKTWTGQGRTPSVIKKAVESQSKRLEDFLI